MLELESWAIENSDGTLKLCSACMPTKGIKPNPEKGFTDSLRGYAHSTHRRDRFVCCYCGLDGKKSFDNWLRLTQEHLLPKTDTRREDPNFIVAACMFCNVADNRFFDYVEQRGLSLEGKTRDELIAQRVPFVAQVRANYAKFWNAHVSNSTD